jgi:AraC-like DNA-binding protein
VVIQFLPEFWGKAFESLPEMLRVNRLLAKADRGLLFSGPAARLAGQQMQSMQKMNPLERLTTFVLILDRLAGCRKVRTLASPTFAGMVRSQDRHRLDKLHAYIHQHFDQSIGLSDAAKVVAMNPTAFARYFRRMTGQSFVGYLQQLRVGHVCRQLIESDAPITDICYANGFGTLSNFNRVFARLKGCTPRDYRQQYTQSH